MFYVIRKRNCWNPLVSEHATRAEALAYADELNVWLNGESNREFDFFNTYGVTDKFPVGRLS